MCDGIIDPNTIETVENIRKSWDDPDITTLFIRKSWKNVFNREFNEDYFQKRMKIFKKLVENDDRLVFPSKYKVFSAFNLCSLKKVKVVIIGQDAYHANPNEAQGLCFSVPPGMRVPPSLVNVFTELERDPEVDFVLPKHGNLISWAKQGVLLLNASLTVWQKDPGSHMRFWEDFTDKIIGEISQKCDGVVFMLWGKFAESKKKLIDEEKHCVLVSQHPSPLATGKDRPFIGNGHFSKANKYLESKGKEKIEWKIIN